MSTPKKVKTDINEDRLKQAVEDTYDLNTSKGFYQSLTHQAQSDDRILVTDKGMLTYNKTTGKEAAKGDADEDISTYYFQSMVPSPELMYKVRKAKHVAASTSSVYLKAYQANRIHIIIVE